MDWGNLNPGSPTRLRLARSRDRGRTFTTDTVPVTRVGDKPELAVSADGSRIAIVYEAGPASPSSRAVTGALLLKSTSDAGATWSAARAVSAAARPTSNDLADQSYPAIVAQANGRVCVVWVDDRRGALDTFARCSPEGARTWGSDIWLSNRADGAAYKSPQGFTAVYGHYGGAAISSSGRLLAVWAEGERDYRTGSVWFNSVPAAAK